VDSESQSILLLKAPSQSTDRNILMGFAKPVMLPGMWCMVDISTKHLIVLAFFAVRFFVILSCPACQKVLTKALMQASAKTTVDSRRLVLMLLIFFDASPYSITFADECQGERERELCCQSSG